MTEKSIKRSLSKENKERKGKKLSKRKSGRNLRSVRHFDDDDVFSRETILTEPVKRKKSHRKKPKRSKSSNLEEQLLRLSAHGDGPEQDDARFARSKSVDDVEQSRESAIPRRHSIDNSDHTRKQIQREQSFWESAYRELQAELTSLRLDKKGLEAKVEKHASVLKEERTVLMDLEAERLDMQLDLAETRKVRDRLERENNGLQKKLMKAEAENLKLRGEIKKLTGTRENDGYETGNEQKLEQSPSDPRSLWSLLSEEVVETPHSRSSSQSPSRRAQSSRGLLGSLFSSAEDECEAVNPEGLRPLTRMPQNESFRALRRNSSSNDLWSKRVKSPLRGAFIPAM